MKIDRGEFLKSAGVTLALHWLEIKIVEEEVLFASPSRALISDFNLAGLI